MPKGKLREPNDQYKRIVAFLRTVQKSAFTLKKVFERTGIPIDVIGGFLLNNIRRGSLMRTGVPGSKYRIGGYSYRVAGLPALQESKGAVAQVVWEVFSATRTVLRRVDVKSMADRIGLRDFSKDSINTVISRFHREGALTRRNGGYTLNRSFKQRPITTG